MVSVLMLFAPDEPNTRVTTVSMSILLEYGLGVAARKNFLETLGALLFTSSEHFVCVIWVFLACFIVL